MRRLAGMAAILAAGLGVGVAWGASPPIVAGASTSMTATGGSTTAATPTPVAPTPIGPASGASVAVSSAKAGARPVVLTLRLRYEMQCGDPGKGALLVKLPSAVRVPASFPKTSAALDGKPATARLVSATTLRVALPPQPQVLCDLIGPGTLTFALTRAADIGNPVKPGAYAVTAQVNQHAFRTTLAITA
jgi:hypothetical protein